MQLGINEIKTGMKIEINNEPYLIIHTEFVKPGKGQAFTRIKLKNILTSRVIEKTYKSGEKLELADIKESLLRLLYSTKEHATFIDDKTFEQIDVPFDIIQEKVQWLKEDTLYEVIFYKDAIIEIIPPTFMELEITETSPGVRGDTASGRVLKPAILETGARVQVPIFIEKGEKVKIDTRSSEYVSRS